MLCDTIIIFIIKFRYSLHYCSAIYFFYLPIHLEQLFLIRILLKVIQ